MKAATFTFTKPILYVWGWSLGLSSWESGRPLALPIHTANGCQSSFPSFLLLPRGGRDSPPSSQDSQTIPPSPSSVGALFQEPGSVLTTELLLLVWTHRHSSLETDFRIYLQIHNLVTICFTLRSAAPPPLFLPRPEASLQAPRQYPPRGPTSACVISGFIPLMQGTSWLLSPVDLLILSLLPEAFQAERKHFLLSYPWTCRLPTLSSAQAPRPPSHSPHITRFCWPLRIPTRG